MRISGHHHRNATTYRRKQALIASLCQGDQVASAELRLLLKMDAGDKLRGAKPTQR